MTATLRQGLAGALGGWLGYLLLEPGIRRQELAGEAGSDLSLMLAGFLLGGIITFCLAAADELPTRRWLRMATRGAIAGLGGALLGYVFLFVAGGLYREMAPLSQAGGPVLQVLRRTMGWSLWGVGVGLGAGLATRSQRRVLQGCVGGLVGGLAGGMLFDLLPALTAGPGMSRLVGFSGLGLCVGLATALVEQLASVAWVRFLTGSREGQVIYLHRDTMVLGRDELADVPLFGDGIVAPAQAILQLLPTPAIHEVGAASLLRVDGTPCRSAQLADGTLIEIGPHRLRFYHRTFASRPVDFGFAEAASSAPAMAPRSHPVAATSPEVTLMGVERASEAAATPAPSLPTPASDTELAATALRMVAGPRVGARLPLRPGLTLGRERDNDWLLEDLKVSRYHARIDRLDESWVISDLESRNGTRLNGVRIVRGGLQPGDFLYLGDCVLRVETDVD